jgi:hypothetical protein
VFSELAAENHLQFEAVVFPSNRWYEIDTLLDQQAANQLLTSWPSGELSDHIDTHKLT